MKWNHQTSLTFVLLPRGVTNTAPYPLIHYFSYIKCNYVTTESHVALSLLETVPPELAKSKYDF